MSQDKLDHFMGRT